MSKAADAAVFDQAVHLRHAGWGSQTQTKNIATQLVATNNLAGQLKHRQLAGGQHAIPMQHTLFDSRPKKVALSV